MLSLVTRRAALATNGPAGTTQTVRDRALDVVCGWDSSGEVRIERDRVPLGRRSAQKHDDSTTVSRDRLRDHFLVLTYGWTCTTYSFDVLVAERPAARAPQGEPLIESAARSRRHSHERTKQLRMRRSTDGSSMSAISLSRVQACCLRARRQSGARRMPVHNRTDGVSWNRLPLRRLSVRTDVGK